MKDYTLLKRQLNDKLKYVRQGKYEKLPQKFQEIYNLTLDKVNKREILEVATNLLIYLLDAIRKDPENGAKLLSYLSLGYPDKKSTDLYYSTYECVSLRRLYVNSSREFGYENPKTQSLILNAYFRWYCATYETYRKFLIYCLFCNKVKTGQVFANLDSFLYDTASPVKSLIAETPIKQHEAVLKYYNGEIRHSISHSNVCVIAGEPGSNLHSILVRMTSQEKNNIIEKYYANIVDFANQTERDTTIMYQSMRLFVGVATSYITHCYGDYYNEIVGDFTINPYYKRMIQNGLLF
jgi:hypothetical protein